MAFRRNVTRPHAQTYNCHLHHTIFLSVWIRLEHMLATAYSDSSGYLASSLVLNDSVVANSASKVISSAKLEAVALNFLCVGSLSKCLGRLVQCRWQQKQYPAKLFDARSANFDLGVSVIR